MLTPLNVNEIVFTLNQENYVHLLFSISGLQLERNSKQK